MAEIKNNFLSSKMNQDIDDRLMPNNEYRYALNLEINRSENSDVGTLQNILGNSLAINGDFRAITGISDIECIGVLADDSTDSMYLFFTNYTGTVYSTTAKNYIFSYNTKQNTSVLLVTGAFLNFSTQFPIYGINIVENLLFWTDNRNQPRKINVQKANPQLLIVPTYYSIEEQISVAKLSPMHAPELFRESVVAPGSYETSMYDVTSPKLPNGTTTNPYYDQTWAGDPAYLEGRYVRFSYRYKFEDGEYSIMAPFTQIAYIPRQDGFFMYSSTAPTVDDEESAYRSTIVSFMQNKVNNIYLQIKLPYNANGISSLYKIVEIEILYKEADDLAVTVVDSIPTVPNPANPSSFWNTTSTTYSYNYQSKKPFKTLPNRDVIRVNDITPVKALSQEIVGNRVVYGNYQDKFTYPKYLNYNVGASEKLPFGFTDGKGTSRIEYPNHSVKENRNYQVGVILADRFGRESGVILSDKTTSDASGTFGASSLYLPYTSENEITPYNWAGNSLKVLFNETISPNSPDITTGWPGLYNGDSTSASYNPLGWYSYKIVVKQTEQDYYNVYLPGVMAAYPENPAGATVEIGKTSHTVLLNDNINKVPRDLSEVGPSQKQFRSSVILFPRVNNNVQPYNNQQFFPGNEYAFVSTIATNNSLFYPDGVSPTIPPTGFENFYQIDSDPLIARISTAEKLGVTTTTNDVINLAVYETKPTESRLDIYWETSTSGTIAELNAAISSGSPSSITAMDGWAFSLSESAAPGTIVTPTPLVFKDIIGNEVTPTSVIIAAVYSDGGVSFTSKFNIENIPGTNGWRVKTAPGAYFYYGYNASTYQSYNFSIVATIGSPPTSQSFVREGTLSNVLPTITNKPTAPINKNLGDVTVYDFNGVNGSNVLGGFSTSDLTWSVTKGDGTATSVFTIDSAGVLKNPAGTAEGQYDLIVKMTEASGASDSVTISVVYPISLGVFWSSWYEWPSGPGTNSTSGTVRIAGNPATFKSFAQVYAGGLRVQSTITIGSTTQHYADQSLVGLDESLSFTLNPGTYNYTINVVKTEIVSGSPYYYGNGGVSYTQ